MTKNNGCFMTGAEVEYLREKLADDHNLARLFNHIDALEALIQEKTEAYEEMIDESTNEWADIGSYIVDSEYVRDETKAQIEALTDRIRELERLRDLNKADAIMLASETLRLMRKVPYSAR